MFKNEISKGIIHSILVLSGIILGIYLLYEIKILVGYVLIAAIISLIGRPIVVFLNNRLKLKNTSASIITMVIFLTIIVGIISLFIPLVFEIGKKILKKVNNKKIPLMVDLTKSILNNKKLNIRW